MIQLNETHDPGRRSWVDSANAVDSEFPIQNLPFGVFQHSGGAPRGGVAIGDQIFDLELGLKAGVFSGEAAVAAQAAAAPTLNALLDLGPAAATRLRARLSELLRVGGPDHARQNADALLVPSERVRLLRPVELTAFTDFSCSLHHVRRLTNGSPWPVLHHLPVAYNGRASSVAVSGAEVRRPNGQFAFPPGAPQVFGAEPALDFELEFGAYISGGNPLGQPLSLDEAATRLFGYCLVNDWSARGIQMFEKALGPFLGKSFLTTVSPWIVTDEALWPFKIGRAVRSREQPAVPTHLDSSLDRTKGSLDIDLEAHLATAKMRAAGDRPVRIVHTNFKHMYWTLAQMAAHQASNGCNLQSGDLIASGTASGPDEEAKACLMEITYAAQENLELPNGETRLWLEDGDQLQIRARASRDGFVSIGFGPCDGRVVPAVSYPVHGERL
ncbi:MAG TPA: fumarylacetoacetase [Steroidobacteraceae bacterium]|nr:fumarylacetoacetase [Steroidobacteraceae bacterium]